MSAKVALVTGGSSGIGEATAVKLQELGYITYAAARRVQRMEHLTGSGIRPLAMDVTDEESMQSGVTHLLGESPPSVIANAIGKAVTARHPRTRYAVGYGARPIIFMHAILPDRWYDAFIRRATGVPS